MTERNLFDPRRTHANRGRARRERGAGAETTVAGVASRRCAPPPRVPSMTDSLEVRRVSEA